MNLNVGLRKPLISKVKIDSKVQIIRYDYFSDDCFYYRRYGPSQKIRLAKTRANLEEDIVMEQPLNNATMVIPDKSEKYGPQMLVERRNCRANHKGYGNGNGTGNQDNKNRRDQDLCLLLRRMMIRLIMIIMRDF